TSAWENMPFSDTGPSSIPIPPVAGPRPLVETPQISIKRSAVHAVVRCAPVGKPRVSVGSDADPFSRPHSSLHPILHSEDRGYCRSRQPPVSDPPRRQTAGAAPSLAPGLARSGRSLLHSESVSSSPCDSLGSQTRML